MGTPTRRRKGIIRLNRAGRVLATLLFALAAAGGLSGCALLRGVRGAATGGEGVATNALAGVAANPAAAESTSEPRIRPGLVLRVTVIAAGRKEVDEDNKRVSDGGAISLPLVGSVDCSGLTLGELTRRLETLYGAYIRDPQVVVAFVVESQSGSVSPWGSVLVLGRVKQPGNINIPPTRDLTVSRAIQMAGGLDTSARDTAIRVTHHAREGAVQQQIEVNLRQIGAQGKAGQDIVLESGDVVYVPESIL